MNISISTITSESKLKPVWRRSRFAIPPKIEYFLIGTFCTVRTNWGGSLSGGNYFIRHSSGLGTGRLVCKKTPVWALKLLSKIRNYKTANLQIYFRIYSTIFGSYFDVLHIMNIYIGGFHQIHHPEFYGQHSILNLLF